MADRRARALVTRAGLLRVGAAALGASALAACLPQQPSEANRAVGTSPLAVTFWLGLGQTGTEGKPFADLIQEQAAELLSKLATKVTVEDGGADKVIVAAAGGAPPHVASVAYWDGARLFAPGITVDPDEELKRVREWGAQRKDLFPGMLETVLWLGKLTSIPTHTNNRGIYYDKNVLAKAGVALPTANWTRDEFTQKAIRAAAPPERWGFAFRAYSLDYLIFYGAGGGKLMNKEQTKWTLDNELGRETLRYMHDLVYARQVTPTPPPGEMMRTGEGKVAFDMTGNFRLPVLRRAGVDVGAAPIPVYRSRFTLAHGWTTAVLRVSDAKVQHAAARLAMWFNAPAFQVPYIIRSSNIPVSKAALEHKDFQQALAQDPVVKVFAEQAPYAYRIPTFPSARKSEFAFDDFVRKALHNEMGLNDALAEGQRAAQVILDEDLRAYTR